jgi:PAS domain S-box-containing protein
MMNVLYADDETGMLDVGKEFLEMSGKLKVETASSAKDALTKMADRRFDVIVSDYQMPEMDGLEFLKHVRLRDKFIPFILFTGHGREEVVIDACHAGVSCYLQKGGSPLPMFVELEHRIEQAVKKQMAEIDLQTKNIEANLAMDLAKIASWEYDPVSNLFNFDDNFYSLYGTDVSREGVRKVSPDQFFSKFVHPDDRQTVMDRIQKGKGTFGPEGYNQIEHRIVTRDGEVRWIAVRVGALLAPDGQLIKVCGVSQDITNRYRSETR